MIQLLKTVTEVMVKVDYFVIIMTIVKIESTKANKKRHNINNDLVRNSDDEAGIKAPYILDVHSLPVL